MRTIINHGITKQERALGVSLEWLRAILRTSLPAFFKIMLMTPLGNHRRHLPRDAWHAARLVATLHEDCGECVQIVINMARNEGIAPHILQAVLDGQTDRLGDLADVCRFARIIVSGGDDATLRDSLRAQFGEEALLELALAIAMSRVIPTTKRALGYAQSCSVMKIRVASPKDSTTVEGQRLARAA